MFSVVVFVFVSNGRDSWVEDDQDGLEGTWQASGEQHQRLVVVVESWHPSGVAESSASVVGVKAGLV